MSLTAEGVAWFWMSEGHANVYVSKRKLKNRTYTFLPEVCIVNTDLELLDALATFLQNNQIHFGYSLGKSTKRKGYRIRINSLYVKKFIELVYPWLLGRKKQIADLILQYFREVYKAAGKTRAWSKGESARFLKGIAIYYQISRLNGRDPQHLDKVIAYALKLKEPYPYQRVSKICEQCSKTFIVRKYRENTARFCSLRCRQASPHYHRKRLQPNPELFAFNRGKRNVVKSVG